MSKKSSIIYFDKKGKENTNELIKLVIEYQKQNSIKHIVISTNTGNSALI